MAVNSQTQGLVETRNEFLDFEMTNTATVRRSILQKSGLKRAEVSQTSRTKQRQRLRLLFHPSRKK